MTRPGDRALHAWHGGKYPSHIASRLALPADQLDRIGQELEGLFTATTRHELDDLTAATAKHSSRTAAELTPERVSVRPTRSISQLADVALIATSRAGERASSTPRPAWGLLEA